MHSRNGYLKVIKESYFKAKTRKEKTKLLDEYRHNTGQSRKYVIWKIHQAILKPKQRKKRKEKYDGQVKAALVKIWEIFDYPCGQRLKPLLETEVDRLTEFGEIEISDEIALKLEMMSPATIDRKLKHQRDVLHLLKSKSGFKPGSLLKQKIPIRLTEWDTSQVGYVEADTEPPACLSPAITVLARSMVTSIGPTPPGTGVIASAFSSTASKSTSPIVFLFFVTGSSTQFEPKSITITPFFTISAVMKFGLFTETMSISALRV